MAKGTVTTNILQEPFLVILLGIFFQLRLEIWLIVTEALFRMMEFLQKILCVFFAFKCRTCIYTFEE